MGHQIIKQPDGLLAIFSTETDTWHVCDATPDEVERYFVDMAAERARQSVRRVIGHVVNDEPRRAYAQFAKTFEEADAMSAEHGGQTVAQIRAESEAEEG